MFTDIWRNALPPPSEQKNKPSVNKLYGCRETENWDQSPDRGAENRVKKTVLKSR
jgi:hypothetical protein